MRTSMNFCKLLGPLLVWVLLGGTGGQAFAQLGAGSATSTNGVLCTGVTNGIVNTMTPIFSPTGTISVNANKNSAANPIVTATVNVSMTGCTLNRNGGVVNNLVFSVPVTYGNSGAALHSPMTGISALMTSASGSVSGNTSAPYYCSATWQTPSAYALNGYQATNLVLTPSMTAGSHVFANCNINISYTVVFFANGSFNASNAQGNFTTGVFNGASTAGGWVLDRGWGQLGSSAQLGPPSNSPNGNYSYQFNGGGFTATLDSCTPWVNLVNSPNGTVTLPTVTSVALNGAGKTTGSTPFTIQLNSCYNNGSNYSATASWTYTPFSGTTDVIANTGTATGVGIQITESTSGNPVLVNGATGATTWSIDSGTNSAPAQSFNAMYYSTGTTNLVGTVSGTANYTMSYN